MRRLKKRGQSTLEYVIIIVAIVLAFLFMQTYIRRAVSGRLKTAADDVGFQFSTANTATFNLTTTRDSKYTETGTTVGDTYTVTTDFTKDITNRTGNESITGTYKGEPGQY